MTSKDGKYSPEMSPGRRDELPSFHKRDRMLHKGAAILSLMGVLVPWEVEADTWPGPSIFFPRLLKVKSDWREGGGRGEESKGRGKHYAILECYFYFKSHHV